MMTLQGMADHRFTSVYFIYQCISWWNYFFPPNFLSLFLLGPYLIRYMCTLLGKLPHKRKISLFMLRINWSRFGLEDCRIKFLPFIREEFLFPCHLKEMIRTLRVKKCLSLISISSYVVQGTKETGNIYGQAYHYMLWQNSNISAE